MTLLRTIVTLIFLSLCGNAISSNTIDLKKNGRSESIRQYIEIAEAQQPDYTLDQAKKLNFAPIYNWRGAFKSGTSYWGRFSLKNTNEKTRSEYSWILEFPLMLTDIDVFVISDGIDIGRTGQFVPKADRSFAPTFKANIFQLNVPPGKEVEIYFEAKCERWKAIPKFDLELYSSSDFYEHLRSKQLRQGLFVGFMLMMLIYNLFLYVLNARDKPYLFYTIYILGIILYSSYNSGLMADVTNSFLSPQHPKYAYLGKTSTYLIIYGYLHFLKSFINLESLLPRWERVVHLMLWLNFVSFFSDIVLMLTTNFNPNISDFITVGNSIVFLVIIFSICLPMSQTKDRKSLFIIAGIIVMGIGAIFTILARIQGIDYSTAPFQVGTAIEIIIFSLGLAYRRRQMLRISELYVEQLSQSSEESADNDVITQLQKSSQHDDPELISDVKDIVTQNMSDLDFGVDELGKKLSLSKNQLYRKIKTDTGMSTSQFVREIRLNAAKELLLQEELNISEIAYMVGFKDPNYFTRLFKKRFGKSPREFINEKTRTS